LSKVIVEIQLGLKPFSANKMHYARMKRDTKEYRRFKEDIVRLLGAKYKVNKDDKYKLTLVSGFSNRASDLDNTFKPLLDSMQLAMGFDDKQVYEVEAYKDVQPKGDEYLYIKLEKVTNIRLNKQINKITGATDDTRRLLS
tara:strand:- start:303 stop:725 length:423 start_codon:yes stop_codon:yes gene_type:complete